MPLTVDLLTLFPGMFTGILSESIIRRAREAGVVEIDCTDIRDYTTDPHRSVDDRPYGGGPGMVFKPEPVFRAVEAVLARRRAPPARTRKVILTPQGKQLRQGDLRELASAEWLVLLCGHYEGFDERIHKGLTRISHHPPATAPYVAPWTASEPTIRSSTCKKHASGRTADSSLPDHDLRHLRAASGEKCGPTGPRGDQASPIDAAVGFGFEEYSIGDYILSGGEVAAMVILDGVVRLLPGALGDANSAADESFEGGLLEYPHYTRPPVFRGMEVPEVLLSGDHGKIEAWRKAQALLRTRERRGDLLADEPVAVDPGRAEENEA